MHAASRRPVQLTLPARFYTDPAHFRSEIECFFFNSWICAGRLDHIPRGGDYFVRDVAGESIIVLRGDEGAVRAFYNVCRHRGTRLCEATSGTFKGSIQCPYHAWTYDLDGRLIGAPHTEAVDGFDRRLFPLKHAAIEVWDGHIFTNLSPISDAEGPVPPAGDSQRSDRAGSTRDAGSSSRLDRVLGPLGERFRPWRMEDLRTVHRIVYDVQANWKLIVQNYSECLHCPVLHPLLNRMQDYLGADNAPSGPGFCGGTMALKEGVETLSADGRRRRRYLPGLGERERSLVSYYAIYPNLLLTLHPDYMVTVTIWPKAPSRTELICEWHFHRDEVDTPDFVWHDAVEFWDATNREDWHISELSQAGISSRAYEPGPYSTREQLLWDFDREVMRRLGIDKPA